jgi:hypothetical protein
MRRMDRADCVEPIVTDVLGELVERQMLAPLILGGDDEHLFLSCDLASLAENRLGIQANPWMLRDAERLEMIETSTDGPLIRPSERISERCFWLTSWRNGDARDPLRVGTIAVSVWGLGMHSVCVSSLYVFPEFRRGGVAREVLDALRVGLGRHQFAMRVDADWCWQRSLSWYMCMGAWVRSWKRDLALIWYADALAPEVEVGSTEARLAVTVDGKRHVLIMGERHGDRLRIVESLCEVDRVSSSFGDALTTFSVGLALQGWPLVRSDEDWERYSLSDAGHPEALARRIQKWEAWSRHRGWRVDTPRLPGFAYPTWSELEAK